MVKGCRIYQDLSKQWTVLWYPPRAWKTRALVLPTILKAKTKQEAIAKALAAHRTHARFGVSSDVFVPLKGGK